MQHAQATVTERLTEIEDKVKGVVELQGPTLDRLEASVSKIMAQVAPGGTDEEEVKEEEARGLLLQFPPTWVPLSLSLSLHPCR